MEAKLTEKKIIEKKLGGVCQVQFVHTCDIYLYISKLH